MQNSKILTSASDSPPDEAAPANDDTTPPTTIQDSETTTGREIQPVPSLAAAPSPEESTVQDTPQRSRSLRMQWRFWRTLVFAWWMFFRLIFWQLFVSRYFPRWVERTSTARWSRYAREYRAFAVGLGGVFIKLGQFISTRVDVLPEEIIHELESLQDEVPTVAFDKIRAVMVRELGAISERFAWINETPIAAASLGQVHRAALHNGERVVIKVQRPGIRETCYTDLAAMRVVARFAMRWSFVSNRADAGALVEEFGRVLLEELSYKHEAYNAVRFGEIFKNNPGIYIPTIYHEHSTDQVLTMEDVTSIKITDYAAMERAGINRKAVAKRLMETYLAQVFNEYFFHADPHPGNLFVYPLPVEAENADYGPDGRAFYLIFVDFGMTGTLTREIADGMVSTLSAVLTRDAESLVQSYVRLGFVLPGADIDRIIVATRAAFDQVWGLSMSDIRNIDYDKVQGLAAEFNDLIFSMPFYIPQDFIYLGRTISILSGMCTNLDPDFNPWNELQPYTEVLVARGFGINVPQGKLLNEGLGMAVLQNLFNGNGPQALRVLGEEIIRRALPPATPANGALQHAQETQLQAVVELSQTHSRQLKRLERENRRTRRMVVFGSLLIASTLLYVNGEVTLAAAGLVACGLVLVYNLLRD
jgi:predicted unusual protein kinase regulating ubiquinone biosynthesis (AarF/ABC1/UbiB family)